MGPREPSLPDPGLSPQADCRPVDLPYALSTQIERVSVATDKGGRRTTGMGIADVHAFLSFEAM
jgi:hypothetical protein